MIPLRVRFEGAEGATSPFVLRIAATGGSGREAVVAGPEFEAVPTGVEDGILICRSVYGELRFRLPEAGSLVGDILLLHPGQGVAQRLIRAGSVHNTLIVTERCDQLCLMCSQPPKATHSDMFSWYEQACLLAPRDSVIGLSGGEPLLYKDALLAMIGAVVAKRPDIGFHVLTNAQHFLDEDVPRLSGAICDHVLWGVPLYAADARVHDYIVGKAGAFANLVRGLGVLGNSGSAIEMRTVLMTVNSDHMLALARFVTANLRFARFWAVMQMERFGYGKLNWDQLFFDHSEDFGQLAAAINYATVRGMEVALYNFPLCTLPEAYRHFARCSISDWKSKFLDVCNGCGKRRECCGFFEWYDESRGFSGTGALP